jgi:hypothetical protein
MGLNIPSRQRFPPRPRVVTIIAVVNAIGGVFTVLFWGFVLCARLVPFPGGLASAPERINSATTYGFLIGDVAWSIPLLALAAIGLWRMRPWGWTAAQMANALWVYSMTVVWIRDASSSVSPGALLFLPFTLAAFWGSAVLWNHRKEFWEPHNPP